MRKTEELQRREHARPPVRVSRVSRGDTASTAALLGHAVSDAGEILRAELKLAMHEWREGARELTRTVPFGVTGGVLAGVGTVFVLLSLVMVLDLALPKWAAYLVGGGIILGVAGGLFLWVRSRLSHWNGLVPERTLDTLAENRQWIRQQLS